MACTEYCRNPGQRVGRQRYYLEAKAAAVDVHCLYSLDILSLLILKVLASFQRVELKILIYVFKY